MICLFNINKIVTPAEIKKLYKRFAHLYRQKKGFITAENLELIPELSLNPLCHRVIELFDPNGRNQINFRDFVRVLWIFSENASHDQKLQMAFECYDYDRDGKISRDDLFRVLKQMVGKQMKESMLQTVVDKLLSDSETKNPKQGYLTQEEFANAIGKQELIDRMTISFVSEK